VTSVTKQLGLHVARPEEERKAAVEPLWVFSPGRPTSAIRRMGFAPLPGWPSGFYRGPQLPVTLVAISELPKTRETLPLRLLGTGRVLVEAIVEMGSLPRDAWELLAGLGPIEMLRSTRARAGRVEEEIVMTVVRTYEEIMGEATERGRQEGLLEGERRGQGRTVLKQLQLRFGPLSDETVRAVEAASVEELDRISARVLTATTVREAIGR
jgi:hypothetical protein